MFRGTKTLFLLHNCLLSFFCRKHFIATVFYLLGFVHILFYISFIYSSVCELVHFSFLLLSSCCHVILIPASPVFPLYSTGSPISPLFPFFLPCPYPLIQLFFFFSTPHIAFQSPRLSPLSKSMPSFKAVPRRPQRLITQ